MTPKTHRQHHRQKRKALIGFVAKCVGACVVILILSGALVASALDLLTSLEFTLKLPH
jgi:hypothetical protein